MDTASDLDIDIGQIIERCPRSGWGTEIQAHSTDVRALRAHVCGGEPGVHCSCCALFVRRLARDPVRVRIERDRRCTALEHVQSSLPGGQRSDAEALLLVHKARFTFIFMLRHRQIL